MCVCCVSRFDQAARRLVRLDAGQRAPRLPMPLLPMQPLSAFRFSASKQNFRQTRTPALPRPRQRHSSLGSLGIPLTPLIISMAKALDFLADDSAAASSSRRPAKAPRIAAAPASSSSALVAPAKNRRAALPQAQQAAADGDEDEDDDDEAVIASALHKHNVKAGVEVAKAASKIKGKGKAKSGETVGGGSFQSMGE